MASIKIRAINTHFWDDNFIVDLTPTQKLLYLYLLTCPLCNLVGIYEITIKRISFDTGLDSKEIIESLKYLESKGKVYYHDGFVIIFKFLQNQMMNSNMIRGAVKILKDLEPIFKGYEPFQRVRKAFKGFERAKEEEEEEEYKEEREIEYEYEKEREGEEEEKKKVKLKYQKIAEKARPSLFDCKNYFFEQQFIDADVESEKFFHRYESVDWLWKDDIPIRNWKALADAWNLRTIEFRSKKGKSPPSDSNSNANGYSKMSVEELESEYERIYLSDPMKAFDISKKIAKMKVT